MESGNITIPADVAEFFCDIPQTNVGKHRIFTDTEKQIIKMAYENGYRLTDVAQKLKTSLDTMRKIYKEMCRG